MEMDAPMCGAQQADLRTSLDRAGDEKSVNKALCLERESGKRETRRGHALARAQPAVVYAPMHEDGASLFELRVGHAWMAVMQLYEERLSQNAC